MRPLFLTNRSVVYQAPIIPKGGTMRYRSMKNFKNDEFLQDLSNQPWSVCDCFEDPEDSLDMWVKLFTDCIDLHAPWKDKRVISRRDWWADELTQAINIRHTINKKQQPLVYRKQRNLVQKLILHAKRDYYDALLSKGVSSVKQFWNYLRELVPKYKCNSPTRMIFNDKVVEDPVCIANGFNEWFSSVFSKYMDSSQ